jgi:hypothetical protein
MRYGISGDDVVALAREAGERGIGTEDIEGVTIAQAWDVVSPLVDSGRLFRGKVGHRTVRFFATPEWAERYSRNLRRARPTPATSAARQRWSPDAPPHYPVNADGSPAYKVTVCPPCRIGQGRLVRSGFGVPAVFA